MRPERLVAACTTELEEKELAWALVESMGPSKVIGILQSFSVEHLSNTEIKKVQLEAQVLSDSLAHLLAQEAEAGR